MSKKASPKDEAKVVPPEATPETTPPVAPAPEAPVHEVISADADSCGVEFVSPSVGPTTRVFTRELHGDEFLDVAKQFAEKFSGKIVAR